MTSDIIFVLHGASEEKYAGAVAAALAPQVALTVRMAGEACGIQIGAAASCVVIWNQDLIAPPVTEAVLSAVADALACTVIAMPGDSTLPERLRARCVACVTRCDDAVAAAEQVRAALSRMELAVESRPRGMAPVIGREAGAVASAGRSMAVRSVAALAATLAVVGMAAPLIGPHAAANNVDDATREPAARSESDGARETVDAVAPASVSPPARSPVVIPTPEAAAEPATVVRGPAPAMVEPAPVRPAGFEPLNAPARAVQSSKPTSSAAAEGASAPVMLFEGAGKVGALAGPESLGEVALAGAGGAGKHGAVKVSTPEAAASTSGAAAAESLASD